MAIGVKHDPEALPPRHVGRRFDEGRTDSDQFDDDLVELLHRFEFEVHLCATRRRLRRGTRLVVHPGGAAPQARAARAAAARCRPAPRLPGAGAVSDRTRKDPLGWVELQRNPP